jgi:hypothetical protein
VVPSSRTLSSIRGSFGNSLAGNAGIRSSGSLAASSRFSTWNIFGNRIGWFNGGFRGGCFNCGFGFGNGFWPGWGLGWPGLGFGFGGWCDPFYWNSLSWGCPGYGYGYGLGYYGYPPTGYPDSGATYYDNGYSYSAPPDAAPPDDGAGVDQDSGPDYGAGSVPAAPVMDSGSQTSGGTQGAVPVILFLKDDSVYSVRDYWVTGGQLHYVLLNGRVGAFDVDQLDTQRTIDENAKSGVQFVLKPNPSSVSPAPSRVPPANSPEPAPRMDLTLTTPSRT